MIMITIMIMIFMHDSAIIHVDRQQKFKQTIIVLAALK